MPAGRPTKYSPDVAKRICDMISCADVGLSTLLGEHDDLPDDKTVYRWLADNEQFRDQYARAREDQAAFVLDQVPEIADDGRNDWMEKFGRDGQSIGWTVNGEAVARSKLRVETRFKLAEKLAPKKFGARQAIDLKAQVAISDMTEDELRAELEEILSKGIVALGEAGDGGNG